jgi:serine protease inhibitor
MAAEGAVGETAQQMNKVLHLPEGSLVEIHRGQAALQRRFIPAAPPPTLATQIADLRAKLTAANDNTKALRFSTIGPEDEKSLIKAKEIAAELNALLKQTAPYDLKISNALWAEKTYPFRPAFLNTLRPIYGAVFFPVDYIRNHESARREINAWVSEQTNDRVRDPISEGVLDALTRLVITNAVYFKGEWETPFKESLTGPGDFQQAGGRTIQLPMMHQLNTTTAAYAAFDGQGRFFDTPREIPIEMKDDDASLYPDAKGFTMLSLPYRGNRLVMTVLLPRSTEGLGAHEREMTYPKLQERVGRLEQRTVNITLPKFRLEADYKLDGTLRVLGMIRAFNDPALPNGAQFDKMSASQNPQERLFISAVLHKTFVDVGEVGTEAAATTALELRLMSGYSSDDSLKTRPFVPVFNANKPFLFLIRDPGSGSILFMGRYVAAGG